MIGGETGKPIQVGLLGLGTVGCGLVNLWQRHATEIERRLGQKIRISHALVRDLDKNRAIDQNELIISTSAKELLENPDINIIVELIGGEDKAKDYVIAALQAGKAVVTANKALLALHGNEIFQQAASKNLTVGFEAAVAGGIPIIKVLREGLAANQIHCLAGIINGTANYILSQMSQSACDFAQALASAQQLGYAEACPDFDIEGIDAAHKLTLLASLAFGMPLQFDKVNIVGISAITAQDITYAAELGFCLKHLAMARRDASGLILSVKPTLIPHDCLLANVKGVNNAVMVQSDALGSTLYYGPGAGADATASAVAADIIDTVRANTQVPPLAFQAEALKTYPLAAAKDLINPFYLRLPILDKPGMLAAITHVLADAKINIEVLLQKENPEPSHLVPVVIKTHPVAHASIEQALAQFAITKGIEGDVLCCPIETLGAGYG